MRVFLYAAVWLLLANVAIAKDENYNADHFSITIPQDMTSDEREADLISLVFKGDEDKLQKGTLSVSARKSPKLGDFATGWSRLRTATIGNRKVLYEREENASGLKWKVLAVISKAGCEIQDVLYYSRSNDVAYSLHYHCHPDNCGAIAGAFSKILASFKWKSEQ